MKILLTIGDMSITGGAERVVANLANAFVQNGHSVQILSFFRANDSLPYALDERVEIAFMHTQGEESLRARGGVLKRFYTKNLFKFFVNLRVWRAYRVEHVHLQNTNEVRKSKENTEVVLRSVLFIDGIRSQPLLDYDALAEQSQAAGKPMRCAVYRADGRKAGEYEVLTVDPVPDVPARRVHHVELGLV